MDKLFELWSNERQLLAQRFMVFLLSNSILFLGFMQVLGKPKLAHTVGFALAIGGLTVSSLALLYFYRPTKRLGIIEQKLESRSSVLLGFTVDEFKDKLKFGGWRHKLPAIGIPGLFIVLWAVGLSLV